MIVKNGEILAIDHIAHDNTLSGNGTSAKPVGLSQSTKDLIDNKVEKSDFETYKSSMANQIRNINDTITADESNLESYKETVAANFTAVNKRITDVDAAKVNNTTFEQYQTDVTNNFTAVNKRIADVDAAKVSNTTFEQYQVDINNAFTAVDKRIDDVDAAKQNKGDYVSASDFNTYKTNVAGEITRVDGRIDATNTNLENNYYKKSQTYSQSEVDEIVAKLGAYVYVEDVNPDGSPNVDEPSSKVIYLTQIPNETQCLQWIWLETQEWKCIGDTTMNLSAYATKEWTNDNFETIDQFNTTIANYYTKGEVNTELAAKVNNADFNAYKIEANGKFATKQNLTDTKAELEDTIESVSGEIISKVNTDYGTLDDKIDNIATTLSDDYYTSLEIDAILAASGEYYTKTESDTKYAEKEVFNTAINELSSNKLDKSATANWDVTEYTEGENIKIVGHEISGKDWSNEIAAAVENKVDESELENYYTSNQIDNKFVTNDDFNSLDNVVDAIDADLDTLSGKIVTVIKDSETVKAIRSTEPDGTISYTLSAHDGKQADYLWKPTVNAAGDISWKLALTGDTPVTANIKGPQGIQGVSGTPGKDGENGITPKLKIDENDIWNVSYDNEATWTSLGVSATGPKGETGAQGPQGISGTPGKNGENGITPHIGDNNHWFIGNDDTGISATGPKGDTGDDGVSPTVVLGEAVTSELHKNGGTTIKITDKTGDQTFTAWNGNDGTMAGAPGITGYDGITARNTGTTYEIGLSSEFYTAITSVSSKLDKSEAVSTYATKDALDDYLTKNDAAESYQPIGNYLSANALNGYATQSWVEDKNYLVANDIAGKADKTDLQYVSAGVDYVSGAIPDTSDMATKTWVGDQGFLKNSDLTDYATKSYANEASANALSQAESWVETEGYLKSVSVATNSSIDGTGTTNNPLSLKTSAENALKDVANKVAKPDTTQTELNNNYLIYSTLTDPAATTGWMPLSANYYSKSEADGRYQKKEDMSSYLTTAQYETDSAKYVTTGDILTAANNKLTGIKIGNTRYEVPTTDLSNYYTKSETSATGELNTEFAKKLDSTIAASTYQTKDDMSAYVAVTGDQMIGPLELVGSNYDDYYMKATRTGVTGHARFGMGGTGGAVIKADDGTNNAQMVLKANATSGIEILLQHNSNQTIGNVIPMVVETAGWVPTGNDYKLHIVLDS